MVVVVVLVVVVVVVSGDSGGEWQVLVVHNRGNNFNLLSGTIT